jgi:hypothetical protein
LNDVLVKAYLRALNSMKDTEPMSLLRVAPVMADDSSADVGAAQLLKYLQESDANDPLLVKLGLFVFDWDRSDVTDEWTAETQPRTAARRTRIYELLGLASDAAACVDACFPVNPKTSTIISEKFEAWYPPSDLAAHAFYWDRYRDHLLEAKGWNPEAIVSLDEDTTRVMERVSAPTRIEGFGARGLVVGYVQSGKTANFTGVIAKAIDAGYRLVIVLAGTLDILREQTQRRLDMELIGRENILRGRSDDYDDDQEPHDYADDQDWVDKKFISFDYLPSDKGFPEIVRLTSSGTDFRRLENGIKVLEMEKPDRHKPLFDPSNLFSCHARIAVVKKNAAVLNRLIADLKKVKKQLGEIPTLIIDDESDQASVNTTNPKKWADGKIERTSINRLLSELLGLLPRAQYVGYTATPYANVFVDPDDSENIFPKDFLLSLLRPMGYMGVADFHDLDSVIPDDEKTPANSNERAYVRSLRGETLMERDLELGKAIDAFVLTGAVKLYREMRGRGAGFFRHHTMLVHESHKTADHAETAKQVRRIWQGAGYMTPAGYRRLHDLYESDFLPVCLARANGEAFPEDFDDLRDSIGKAIRKMSESGSPIIVVNSDKDYKQEAIDFEKRPVWRILVGGTKLSRGFTVEGLTVSYYRRRTRQAATMMQMGRWFGFRNGYRDLVRLYIGRHESDRNTHLDLYKAFEAMVLDEEDFRAELRRYAELVDGFPQVTPQEIPPLVSQRLPWLRPDSPNKMYNAELVVRRSPGVRTEPRGYPEDASDIVHNYHVLAPTVALADELAAFKVTANTTFDAYVGLTAHENLVAALRQLRWMTEGYFQPDLNFLEELRSGGVTDWLVVVPLRSDHRDSGVMLPEIGSRSVFFRSREEGWNFGAISESRHRIPASVIAGATQNLLADPVVEGYMSPARGAVLVYPVVTKEPPRITRDGIDPQEVTLAFELWAPASSIPANSRKVQFRVRN